VSVPESPGIQSLARAVDGEGSFVFEESRAVALRDGSPAIVGTERGSVRARDVIVATNVPFGDGGFFDLRSVLHRSYLVASRAGSPPLEGTYISVDEPMRSILAIEVDGERYVLAGGEGHLEEETTDSCRATPVGSAARSVDRNLLPAGNAMPAPGEGSVVETEKRLPFTPTRPGSSGPSRRSARIWAAPSSSTLLT
jgi:glycine/D-amino acid oxidase-like deaminating enzyme